MPVFIKKSYLRIFKKFNNQPRVVQETAAEAPPASALVIVWPTTEPRMAPNDVLVPVAAAIELKPPVLVIWDTKLKNTPMVAPANEPLPENVF